DTVLPGPLASALAVTKEDEINSGVIVIDIGSGQTGISAFTGGRYINSATVSMGGGEITLDIAHVLRTPLEEAERIKTLYGTILSAQSNQHDLFTYMSREGGELAEQTATLSDLARIIRSRGNHLLNLAYEHLSSSGLLNNFLGSIVLCGGTSRLPGMTSLAESIFKCNVREGRPKHVSGLPPMLSSPEFSCAVGLLKARSESEIGVSLSTLSRKTVHGYFSRVGQWIREGF
ncbi:MAG: cell division protein FtsA, partial [Hyphomicrobium sp.]